MPLPTETEIPRVSARDAAYERLLDWITLGPLEPGEAIRDAEVAERLGVSRTPVREALQRLERDGLIEVFPGRGTRVAPLRFERARHLFSIGGVLDGLAAEEATPRLSEADLKEIDTVLTQMETIEDPRELQLLDERLHRTYREATGNEPLNSMLRGVTMELRMYDRVGFRDRVIVGAVHGEHRAIYKAFRARDAEAAAKAGRLNWNLAWERIEPILRASGEFSS
jgi:DNA-binding GntR family transcriptional regulator